MNRRAWQREELILALNLYCQLPFGQYNSRNHEIIKLASCIGRTANAVAMKLSNFASFDPYHRARGIKGLQNVGRGDRDIWNEFSANWGELAVESEIAYTRLTEHQTPALTMASSEASIEDIDFSGVTESQGVVKVRLAQQFFRKVLMSSYASKCCICEMPIPELLVASHIVPWRDDEKHRANPHNGLCLCVLHDKGFDRGLITLGESYEILLSKAIECYPSDSVVYTAFQIYDGQRISLPNKFIPSQEFLAIHRERYFRG